MKVSKYSSISFGYFEIRAHDTCNEGRSVQSGRIEATQLLARTGSKIEANSWLNRPMMLLSVDYNGYLFIQKQKPKQIN
jgi:hypothetical protein